MRTRLLAFLSLALISAIAVPALAARYGNLAMKEHSGAITRFQDEMTDGQVVVGQTGARPEGVTVSGDLTMSAAGVATVGTSITKYIPLEISDPGTGAAIPVVLSATIGFTTAAAETNTLAVPTFIGQKLILYVDTYAVGDRVVTVAAAVNVANNNTLTFGVESDACELVAVRVGGSLVWQITWNDGVALSTV